MAQFVYTMNRVGKIVPPKREILKNISPSFFPGAKIGVLGLNGAGKSTLLRIMAGVDTDIEGEARPMPGLKVGYLPQEPELDDSLDVRGNVEAGLKEPLDSVHDAKPRRARALTKSAAEVWRRKKGDPEYRANMRRCGK